MVKSQEKQVLELKALSSLKNILPEKIGIEINDLWNEYEENKSVEAKFVRALDKLETLVQISEAGYISYNTPQFIPNYADKAVNNFKKLSGVLKLIKKEIKAEFDKGNIFWKREYNSFAK